MKVTENSPDRLVVDYRPIGGAIELGVMTLLLTGIGLWLLRVWAPGGCLFLLLATVNSVLLLRAIRREQAVFDRPAGMLRLTRRGHRGTTRTELPLAALTGVTIAPAADHDDRASAGRLVLTRDAAEPIPVSELELALSTLRPVATAIARWLEARPRDA